MRCIGKKHLPLFTKRPRGIGYWWNPATKDREYPDPSELVRPNWLSPKSRSALLQYLRSAPTYCGSYGHSFCRFGCGVPHVVIGSKEYWDGDWVWPEGVAHYVDDHDVYLPQEFVDHVLGRGLLILSQTPAFPDVETDWDYWRKWSSTITEDASP